VERSGGEAFADSHLQDLIRISVGTEHIDDIIADFEQSFKASAADPKASSGAKGTETGDAKAPAKTEV
jgi:O-acetylhomoserine/O-acetylserine sulfhydrylase